MKSYTGGRAGERLRRDIGNRLRNQVRGVVHWPSGLTRNRFLICFATIIVLSALLLVPLPRRGAAVATYNASHPGAARVVAMTTAFLSQSPQDSVARAPKWVSQSLRLSYNLTLGVVLLVALTTGFVAAYLYRFAPWIYHSDSRLCLLAALVSLCVLGLKVGAMLLGVNLTSLEFGYISILCISAATMAITVLLEPYIALVAASLLALLSTLILGNELRYCLMTYVVALVATLSVSAIRGRGDVIRAGYSLVLANVVLAFLIGQVEGDSWTTIGIASLWGAVTGFLSVALFWLGVGLFERPFGTTTHLGLLELSDPNRPLLREFSRTCPGTFAHSLSVGALAAAAADAVGADALLCRVGAYYHDIGKMRRAEFFVENQLGENIHERLNPSLSALVVTAHVKQGLEIAEEAKLPPAIRDIIVQHHGTSLIRYFYHLASEGAAGDADSALEQHFRYPGPKPQTAEAAIMMLADTVEAASRVLERPTPARVDEFVQKMIDEKLADGQLDDAPITLKDLALIKQAFIRVLGGMLHNRLEYPSPAGSGQAGHAVDRECVPARAATTDNRSSSSAKRDRGRSSRTKLRRNPGKLASNEAAIATRNGHGKPAERLFVAAYSSDASSPQSGAQGDGSYS